MVTAPPAATPLAALAKELRLRGFAFRDETLGRMIASGAINLMWLMRALAEKSIFPRGPGVAAKGVQYDEDGNPVRLQAPRGSGERFCAPTRDEFAVPPMGRDDAALMLTDAQTEAKARYRPRGN